VDYFIKRHLDEGQCDLCGDPLYVGDTAYQDPDTWLLYCSKKCALADREQNPPKPAGLFPRWFYEEC
jgi:hypothetical protein